MNTEYMFVENDQLSKKHLQVQHTGFANKRKKLTALKVTLKSYCFDTLAKVV